jgi:hypothetical protein
MRFEVRGRKCRPHNNPIESVRRSLSNCRALSQRPVKSNFSVASVTEFSIWLRVALHDGAAVACLRGIDVDGRALH